MYSTAPTGNSARSTVKSESRPAVDQPMARAAVDAAASPSERAQGRASHARSRVHSCALNRRRNESTCGRCQKANPSVTKQACRWCEQACAIRSAVTDRCVKSRERRVIAIAISVAPSSNQNGADAGSSKCGGCHSAISGRGRPTAERSQKCRPGP